MRLDWKEDMDLECPYCGYINETVAYLNIDESTCSKCGKDCNNEDCHKCKVCEFLLLCLCTRTDKVFINAKIKVHNNKYTAPAEPTPKSCPRCNSESILKNEKHNHYGCLSCYHEWA